MFAALGRTAARRPWYIIAAWVVATVLLVAFKPTVNATTNQADFLPHHYDSIRGFDLIASAFGDAATASGGATILLDHADGSPLTDAEVAKAQDISAHLDLGSAFGAIEHNGAAPNTDVQLPPDGKQRAALVTVDLADGVTGEKPSDYNQIKDLRDRLSSLTEGTHLRAQVGGSLAQSYDQSTSGNNAEAIMLLATVLLLIVLLTVIFRSALITITPLVTCVLLVILTGALINDAAKIFGLQKDDTTGVIIDVVIFGIGTDYILFFLFRYRERMRSLAERPTDKAGQLEQHRASVEYAVTRSGEAIASAAGAVFIAFMTLALSSLGLFKSMGPNLAISVAATLLAALTLVPALTTVFGRALFWPSKKWRTTSDSSRFARIGASVGRRPAAYVGASGLLLVVLAVFATGFNPTFDFDKASSSQSVESAQVDTTKVDRGFPAGAGTPTFLVLHSTTGKALTPAQSQQFLAAVARMPGVSAQGAGGGSGAGTPKLGETLPVAVNLEYDPSSDKALAFVKDTLRPEVSRAAPQGTEGIVTGLTAVFVDTKAAMNRDYTVVFPVAAVITLLILMLVLRSLVAPWYLMISVGLGFAATLGAAVLVFQHLKGDDGMLFLLPLLIYLFVVALGTDYNILMVTRLREEAREGRGPREAAARAVQHAGPTIGAAGLILAGTFASLMLGGNSFLLTLGFAIAFGIALVAFVIAMFFTPALTALVGHAAWWPGHGDERKQETEELVEV